LAGAVGRCRCLVETQPQSASPEIVVVASSGSSSRAVCAVWWLDSSGDKAHTFWKQRRRISTNDSGWF